MNLSQFFEHWRIVENPFRGEEARHDTVFARIGFGRDRDGPPPAPRPATPTVISSAGDGQGRPADTAASGAAHRNDLRPDRDGAATHSDFEKILGDLYRPSTAIVFGEKGSGKTAIRMQIADRIAAHNARRPDAKVLLVPYDDLNGVLERFTRRVGGKTPLDAFQKFRLVDHLDAILGIVVPRLIDALLMKPADARAMAVAPSPSDSAITLDAGPDARKISRRLDAGAKRDLLLLQAVYDRPDQADLRTGRLRRLLRVNLPGSVVLWNLLAWLGWIPAAALFIWAGLKVSAIGQVTALTYVFAVLLGLWLLVLAKRYAWDNLALLGLARRIRRQLRVIARSEPSLVRSMRQIDPAVRDAGHLPLSDADEARYTMLDRLRRTLRAFGYVGMFIVIDRVDEPTLISGDPDRMRAVIWPLFNNKFLQQESVGIKMLLPIELRHALFKESSAFFQEARLDKQNLVERLSWTGAMLYDLCDARLKACHDPAAGVISLLDLFAEDVTGKDLVDALDQMHQPRDAFKFLYACLAEHCSNVTAEQEQWKIPRLVLETVRKQQSDRVQQLYRGIRPA
jgi:hypothetical protein